MADALLVFHPLQGSLSLSCALPAQIWAGAVPLPRRRLSQGFWCGTSPCACSRPFDLMPFAWLLPARVSSFRPSPLRCCVVAGSRLSPRSRWLAPRLSPCGFLRCARFGLLRSVAPRSPSQSLRLSAAVSFKSTGALSLDKTFQPSLTLSCFV
jgi:hypothetical protein